MLLKLHIMDLPHIKLEYSEQNMLYVFKRQHFISAQVHKVEAAQM